MPIISKFKSNKTLEGGESKIRKLCRKLILLQASGALAYMLASVKRCLTSGWGSYLKALRKY